MVRCAPSLSTLALSGAFTSQRKDEDGEREREEREPYEDEGEEEEEEAAASDDKEESKNEDEGAGEGRSGAEGEESVRESPRPRSCPAVDVAISAVRDAALAAAVAADAVRMANSGAK
ncbi:unnamed protein product [Closterium sp. NIES-64]|nr:unnamed protein product [Closterium sp. NIES-64]